MVHRRSGAPGGISGSRLLYLVLLMLSIARHGAKQEQQAQGEMNRVIHKKIRVSEDYL
jgi:hypothetical protein